MARAARAAERAADSSKQISVAKPNAYCSSPSACNGSGPPAHPGNPQNLDQDPVLGIRVCRATHCDPQEKRRLAALDAEIDRQQAAATRESRRLAAEEVRAPTGTATEISQAKAEIGEFRDGCLFSTKSHS